MAELIFRPAVGEDLNRLRDIAFRAYAKYVSRIGREPAPMVADFAAHIVRNEIIVAVSDDVVCGYIVSFPRVEDFFIENVAVDPDAAGTGIGRALMSHAEKAARAAGCNLVRLYTNVKMHENFPFYEALGYLKTHDVTESGFHRVYFEKALEQA
ncbi:GNAT family N-acetyltransferase [Thalassospiraceae bacterium LMO-JJ14]|nr:GNAT family N-acetyltransferase [Thalassospiraceae bacterium LMO-JJ14]